MQTLWAPWRMQYIEDNQASGPSSGCFLCDALLEADPAIPKILARTETAFVIMNRYPYNSGHLMIAPCAHVGEIGDVVAPETITDMWRLLAISKQALTEVMQPQGFNVGINQGVCAGAGLRTHLHIHMVPRWEGDCNFMPVTADTKVMPQALDTTWALLRPVFDRLLGG